MSKKRKTQINIPTPLSILLLPILVPTVLVVAGLSIPYTLVVGWVGKRREERLEAELKACGRVIGWNEFINALDEGRGTLIEERFSSKMVRSWWVSEDIYKESPYPTVDWLTMYEDPAFRPFALWCRQRYTDREAGRALLVSLKEQKKDDGFELWSRLRSESDSTRWIEVIPPESLKTD